MTSIDTGSGLVQRDKDGRVTLIRSLRGMGIFIHLELSAAEIGALRSVLDFTEESP